MEARFNSVIFVLIWLLMTSASIAQPNPELASSYQIKPLVTGKHSMIVTNNKWKINR
jgi:hypothetical protein